MYLPVSLNTHFLNTSLNQYLFSSSILPSSNFHLPNTRAFYLPSEFSYTLYYIFIAHSLFCFLLPVPELLYLSLLVLFLDPFLLHIVLQLQYFIHYNTFLSPYYIDHFIPFSVFQSNISSIHLVSSMFLISFLHTS